MALLAGLTAGEAVAGNLTSYATGDVLICFRNGGANDLVVDAGPISNFTSLSTNQRYSITTYTGNQLALVATNGLDWLAFTWLSNNTLYITKPRSSAYTQTAPWLDASSGSQQGTAFRMSTIPVGAVDEAAYTVPGASFVNTATAVVEEDISAGNGDYPNGVSYHDALYGASPIPNFSGTFQGNPENTTTNHFTTQAKVVRSDFYKLTPTSGYGLAQFLGYFELNTNGAMTYVANPMAPTVATVAASAIVDTSAQLNATVNPNADATTTLYFQYGLDTTYGSTTTTTNVGLTSGAYSLPVSSLTAGTTYHFQAVSYNFNGGTNYGADLTFTTTGGSAPTIPVFAGISFAGGVATINYTTGLTGTYTLRYATNLATAGNPATWPALQVLSSGDNNVHMTTDTTTDHARFYTITAQ